MAGASIVLWDIVFCFGYSWEWVGQGGDVELDVRVSWLLMQKGLC